MVGMKHFHGHPFEQIYWIVGARIDFDLKII
jgi:hypothetical protein